MASGTRRAFIFLAIVVLAAALRLPALEQRPMHADEAVHAAKLGALIEKGIYRYDPAEYHGPTLYYLALIPAHLRGVARYADLDETILRSVPAAAGVLLVAMHVLLVPVVGFRAAAFAALLAAVSPAMVYYSRYFIQETLLVVFSFGALVCVCRYLRSPGAGWAVGAGVSAGLMFATKETWILAAGSMVGAFVLARAAKGRSADAGGTSDRRAAAHAALAALSAAVVSALFFSSFFTHPQGIVDSVAAYRTYAARAAATSWHLHPWYYYLGLLLYFRYDGGPLWTEAAIFMLAAVGLSGVWRRRAGAGDGQILLFLGGYAVLMTVIYSAIPYKTPWCVLGFLHGTILVAGAGAARLIAFPSARAGRAAVSALVAAVVIHLGQLAWSASFPFASDPRNPYVYAHTGTGVFEIVRRVEALADRDPAGAAMAIEVISGQNLWPLPWYLRRHPVVRWETAPVNDGVNAPVILATPDMEDAVVRKLYEWRPPGERELYVPVFDHPVELRPRVEVRGYAAKSLWDRTQVQ
jgi:uncharacterized protein (TIGR03663 family)